MDEFQRIHTYLKPLASGFAGAFSLGDDVAALPSPPPGKTCLVGMDTLVENVHFLPESAPDKLAEKLLAVNLSDLAAKGAQPLAYFLSLSLPETCGDDWLAQFASGLARMQKHYGFHLAGGDSTRTAGVLTLSATCIGLADTDSWPQRASAQAGDQLYVSGPIGDGGVGLSLCRGEVKTNIFQKLSPDDISYLQGRYLCPVPQLEKGAAMAGLSNKLFQKSGRRLAAIDISDGLAADLGHLCAASQLQARVEIAKVPLSAPVQMLVEQTPSLLPELMGAGDDYQLLVAAPPEMEEAMIALSFTPIGHLQNQDNNTAVSFVDSQGRPVKIASPGWNHNL